MLSQIWVLRKEVANKYQVNEVRAVKLTNVEEGLVATFSGQLNSPVHGFES